jgi:hypothetical protein
MATHNVNDILVLSKEALHGLKRMQELGSKVFARLNIAFAEDYEEWGKAMDESRTFWEEIKYREKVSLALLEYEGIKTASTDIVNLSNFIDATGDLLNELGGLTAIMQKINNYKYQYDCVANFFELVNKKASLQIKD